MSDDAFWQDLFERESIGRLEKGEMTPQMVADRIGKSRAHTYNILQNLLKEGKVTRRHVLINGRRCWAYKPIQKGKTNVGTK